MKCFLCMVSYCLACLERCVKFITRNAYIQVVLTSKNFCVSAWKAFCLIVGNAGRFAVVHTLGSAFMFLGKLLIVAAAAYTCYVMITNVNSIKDEIYSPFIPIVVAGIIGYVMASIFLSIFGFAIDTILQCFLVDETLAGEGNYGAHRPKTMDVFFKKVSKK